MKRQIHNHTKGGIISRTFSSWRAMRSRCYRENFLGFENYGGRGITVCERWRHSFVNFLADMGERPAAMSIGRINNDGPYEPANCRWETREQQQNNTTKNRLITFNGETLSLNQWSRRLGLGRSTLNSRLKRLSVEESFKPGKRKRAPGTGTPRIFVGHGGSHNSHAVLTEADIPPIRTDPRSHREIAVAYGVSENTIGSIKRGCTWRHV